MCGIAGVCLPGDRGEVDKHILTRMTNVIVHRGPDGEGLHFDECVALGHRRLSIIDLVGGDQPIYSADGSLAIVFNGEIYNYKELRQDLVKAGYIFKTQSDTEVIVHLYDQKGEQCVDYLNGMFAFVIWDRRSKTLFAARDRFGEKPFYYQLKDDGTFLFASEIKSILEADLSINYSLDKQAIDDYFAYGYVPAPRSIYQSIKKLPAAHTLTYRNGNVAINRYWSHLNHSISLPSSQREVVEYVESMLADSIKLRLRSDVPVGAFLSGGVDSSLIVAMASEQSQGELSTFSIGFSEREFDESLFARFVASKYQTNHKEIMLSNIDLQEFPNLVRQFDEPFADPSALPTYYVTREAAKYVKVCLSGDAGDELFAGYPQYVLEPGEEWLDKLPLFVRKLCFGVPANIVGDGFRGKGMLRRMSVDGASRYQRTIGVFDSIERQALLRRDIEINVDRESWLFEPYFSRSKSGIEQRILADQGSYLTDDILVKVDRNSMLNSLEVRVPFLDHRLAELANSISIGVKMRQGKQKWILKELLKSRAPDEIVNRPKQGFAMPIRDWIRTSYREVAKDLLLNPGNKSFDYLDANYVKRLYLAHVNGSRDLSDRLWSIMWFEQWCRTYHR